MGQVVFIILGVIISLTFLLVVIDNFKSSLNNTREIHNILDKHKNYLNHELAKFDEEVVTKKYIVTVSALINGIFFNQKKETSQIIETDDIQNDLLNFQDKIKEQYSNKIIIEKIECREII